MCVGIHSSYFLVRSLPAIIRISLSRFENNLDILTVLLLYGVYAYVYLEWSHVKLRRMHEHLGTLDLTHSTNLVYTLCLEIQQ